MSLNSIRAWSSASDSGRLLPANCPPVGTPADTREIFVIAQRCAAATVFSHRRTVLPLQCSAATAASSARPNMVSLIWVRRAGLRCRWCFRCRRGNPNPTVRRGQGFVMVVRSVRRQHDLLVSSVRVLHPRCRACPALHASARSGQIRHSAEPPGRSQRFGGCGRQTVHLWVFRPLRGL